MQKKEGGKAQRRTAREQGALKSNCCLSTKSLKVIPYVVSKITVAVVTYTLIMANYDAIRYV